MRFDLEDQLAKELRKRGVESPRLEAKWILEKRPEAKSLEDLDHEVKRRLSGEPLAYILESKEFYKHEFFVSPGVLIPRPETEFVVEQALKFLEVNNSAKVIYDFGCGSGCIGLAILKESSQPLSLFAFDQSPQAILVAKKNAATLKLENQTQFFNVDLSQFSFDQIPPADLIVSNPPYIALGDQRVQKEVLKFEPHEALFSGSTGTELLLLWSKLAFSQLKSGGEWIMEVGVDQRQDVESFLRDIGFANICWHQDLAGIDRVVSAQKGSSYG